MLLKEHHVVSRHTNDRPDGDQVQLPFCLSIFLPESVAFRRVYGA